MSALAFRNLLEIGDVEGLRAFYAQHCPAMPQPATSDQAEIVMHRARTEAESVTLRARAYSHCWLTERDLPSGLPDVLKPRAERMFPRVIESVGISVNFRSPWMQGAEDEVRGSMEHAVLDAYADGKQGDPAFIKQRMAEAKTRTMRALFGR